MNNRVTGFKLPFLFSPLKLIYKFFLHGSHSHVFFVLTDQTRYRMGVTLVEFGVPGTNPTITNRISKEFKAMK
jgi:hypothetical protein